MSSTDDLWGIVLAGGEGKRLQDFIRKRYGIERPKQYSAIIGRRSMLRHTLDRIEKIIPAKQLQIVIDRKHRKYIQDEIKERERKAILIAPENRESAASIYLALSHIYSRDPDAIITIFPSDHFIGEEDRFLKYVEHAVSFARKHPDFLVLLGIKPSDVNLNYGWIEPSKKFLLHEGNRFYKVIRFSEKPKHEEARDFYNTGGLWNSLVIAVKCDTLVKMFRQNLEIIYQAFKKAKSIYGTDEEEQFIRNVFESIPPMNFSKCILESIPESLFVLRAEGVLWSDWGTKEQVVKDLDSLGVAR